MIFWLSIACIIAAGGALYWFLRKTPAPPKPAPPGSVSPGPAANAGAAEVAGAAGAVRVHIPQLTCTCAEWRTLRARFRPEDPRRLCAHLCAQLCAETPVPPPALLPFAPLIRHMRAEGQGVPCTAPSFAFVLGETGYLVLLPPEMRPWALVHTGQLRYAFNLDTGCWRDDASPPFAQDIGNLVKAEARRRAAKRREGNARRAVPLPPQKTQ